MKKARVLFVSQDITPYLDETFVGKIARRLPQGIQERGKEIRTFMPKYGNINERRHQLHEVIRLSGMNMVINDVDHPLIIKVASIPTARMQVYFIDNEEYFGRKAVFADKTSGKQFDDNDERAMFFVRGVAETVKKLGWQPDIIHCQGWMTSLVPLYIKTIYKDEPVFRNAKVVYSVFENQFEESLGKDFSRKAGLNEIDTKQVATLAKSDSTALYITGITHADAIVKASDGIDAEVSKFIKKQKGKLMHDHVEGSYGDAYDNLYEELLQSQN